MNKQQFFAHMDKAREDLPLHTIKSHLVEWFAELEFKQPVRIDTKNLWQEAVDTVGVI